MRRSPLGGRLDRREQTFRWAVKHLGQLVDPPGRGLQVDDPDADHVEFGVTSVTVGTQGTARGEDSYAQLAGLRVWDEDFRRALHKQGTL